MKCSCCSEQWNQLPLPLLNFKGKKKAMLAVPSSRATYRHCNPSVQKWDACTWPISAGGSVLGTEQGWSRLPSALQGCTHGTALCQAAAPISCRQTSPQVSLILGTYSKLWDIAHIFSQLHVTAHLERSEGIWLCRARGLQESGVFFCFQDGLGEELVGKQLLEAWWHKEPWKSALQKAEVVRSIGGRCSGML